LPAALPILLLWLAAPLIAYKLSQPVVQRQLEIGPDDRRLLRLIARRTWRYFDELVRATWRDGCSLAWSPDAPEEVAQLAREAERRGGVALLIDEAATWLSASRGRGGELLRLMRRHRHAGVSLHLTTQHLSGDVPQEALSLAPRLLVFRCTAPVVLDRLERDHGLARDLVATLPRWAYLEVRTGFDGGP